VKPKAATGGSALSQLDRKLASDATAILTPREIRLLYRELQRVLMTEFPGLPVDALGHAQDTIRWHALGARCAAARGARGIRDVAVAVGMPQYRIRAIEKGLQAEFRIDLARRYFRFLGIDDWVERWCDANRELAIRIGLLDGRPSRIGRRTRRSLRD
jgi:hypothetical protein